LAAKLRFKGVDRHGYHVQTALWKAGLNRTSRDAVAVPRTLGIDESQRVWYQEWVPGEDMESIATVDSYRALAVAERSAQAIAVLHRTVTHLELKPYTINDEVSSLCEQLDTIRDRSPQYAAGVQEVIRWTSSICDRVKREEPCPIHRDFYPAQVIATRDCLFLCDFDLYCSGPPTLDAGNFLGHLWELSLRRRDQAAIWRDAAQRFTEAYVRTRSQSRSVRQRDCQIDHWAWLTLARQIVISTRISGRDHITPELIDATIRMARRLGKELLPEFPLP
jgi:aminoglycoside phosphotransferase (APT) family kinase protein